MQLPSVVRALAALSGPAPEPPRDVTADGQPFVWLGIKNSIFVRPAALDYRIAVQRTNIAAEGQLVDLTASEVDRVSFMASMDALHREDRVLHEGWVFVVGRVEVDGERRTHCLPLLTRPVHLAGRIWKHALYPAGDRELTWLVRDGATARQLERDVEFGGGGLTRDSFIDDPEMSARLLERLPKLRRWIEQVCDAADLPLTGIVPATTDPLSLRSTNGLTAVVGSGLFLSKDVNSTSMGATLDRWAAVPGINRSSMSAIYGAGPADAVNANREPLLSPLPLTSPQREVVVRARDARLTVVSGAPGNGKSHTVVAIANDAVARGQSVLVATQTFHAADVLTDLLRAHPGPNPVVFGNAERRQALMAELEGGLPGVPSHGNVQSLERAVEAATARQQWLEEAIGSLLGRESAAQEFVEHEATLSLLMQACPGAFDDLADYEQLSTSLDQVEAGPRGLLGSRRHRRCEAEVRACLRAPSAPIAVLREAVSLGRQRRLAIQLGIQGGTIIGSAWEELARTDEELRLSLGSLLSDRVHEGAVGSTSRRRAIAALARALRSGRSARRASLVAIETKPLLAALPLWIGTLRDIEDLLPPEPAMFDVVVLDEASQIDQMRAAPALLRARRAVVVGDPRQLRHVSFVADVDVHSALSKFGVQQQQDRLDVRRNSIFDVAASSAPVMWLDDHFRSRPHLIGFSAKHFYADRIKLMTLHPRNESIDVINLVQVAGHRDGSGVNEHEVDAVLQIVRKLTDAGEIDVGVVSPFRVQADAIEKGILDLYELEELERLHLRVGTVHAFQGAERDVMVVSLALTPDDASGSRRFVEDPNLFNVMVTRARRRLIVVSGLDPDADGLIGSYLSWAERAPSPPRLRDVEIAWVNELALELARLGLPTRVGYPVGPWTVDICAGEGEQALGLEACVHPAGARTHIQRHRELTAAGWRLVDAYPSRWEGDAVRAALTIAGDLRRRSGR
jgi:hypothetical protein